MLFALTMKPFADPSSLSLSLSLSPIYRHEEFNGGKCSRARASGTFRSKVAFVSMFPSISYGSDIEKKKKKKKERNCISLSRLVDFQFISMKHEMESHST